jgi:hypothetical protein
MCEQSISNSNVIILRNLRAIKEHKRRARDWALSGAKTLEENLNATTLFDFACCGDNWSGRKSSIGS